MPFIYTYYIFTAIYTFNVQAQNAKSRKNFILNCQIVKLKENQAELGAYW